MQAHRPQQSFNYNSEGGKEELRKIFYTGRVHVFFIAVIFPMELDDYKAESHKEA